MPTGFVNIRQATKSFDGLSMGAQLRVLRNGMNAALNPGLKAARSAAPRGDEAHQTYRRRTVAPGFLSRSIKKRTSVRRDRKGVIGRISAQPEAFYGSFLESGRKGQRATPFFFRAINSVEDQMFEIWSSRVAESIEREFDKL